ncbi:hypothetical protein LMG28140_02568 [Paraburkholderia metrosideri]|jgi:hypothetical protein|uniref:Uncharacterized protein n=1 Tax=Paraburkholderia metrosideri TaxID=580937 RepID=A0ABM8NLR7_9BURK|nr:hypothetical protein LMG28140_02568 [Paraburkholderia metrosideri]
MVLMRIVFDTPAQYGERGASHIQIGSDGTYMAQNNCGP